MATVKKAKSKFIYVNSDSEEVSGSEGDDGENDGPAQSSPTAKKAKTLTRRPSDEENVDPEQEAREPPKLSNKPPPRQEPPTANATTGQSALQPQPPVRTRPPTQHSPPTTVANGTLPRRLTTTNDNASPTRRSNNDAPPTRLTNTTPPTNSPDPATMIHGGAHIPPNQQRNMRACMVCSVVRTQQQFLTSGCPNCEDILELIGNPEQINDCTSQVFEGLISVADTNRSWVARYQRLEGYVPGVYATQVEGILPEDVLVAVENAGVNYVPRDGSEMEMLGKD